MCCPVVHERLLQVNSLRNDEAHQNAVGKSTTLAGFSRPVCFGNLGSAWGHWLPSCWAWIETNFYEFRSSLFFCSSFFSITIGSRAALCETFLTSSCSLITNCGPTSSSTRLQRPLPLDLRSHWEQIDREIVRPFSCPRGLQWLMNEQIVSRTVGCPDGVDCCHFKPPGVGPGPRHG